mgnify:CR=1 FL=1
MPTHYIPIDVTIISRPEQTISQAHTGRQIKIRPAFVVPASSTKMLLTARRWAASRVPLDTVIDEVTRSNTPMRNLQIFGVDHRSEGGMAFKVITDQGFYVDLREPEFMEALLTGRIEKDGFIKGEYVWSVGGNQMRIVRVGSAIYKDRLKRGASAVTASGRNRVRTLPSKSLLAGHMYESALNGPVVYAGRIRSLTGSRPRLVFAWYLYEPSANSLGRGVGTKRLIISSSSFALRDLGRNGTSLLGVPISNVQDAIGQKLNRNQFHWPDGTAIRAT